MLNVERSGLRFNSLKSEWPRGTSLGHSHCQEPGARNSELGTSSSKLSPSCRGSIAAATPRSGTPVPPWPATPHLDRSARRPSPGSDRSLRSAPGDAAVAACAQMPSRTPLPAEPELRGNQVPMHVLRLPIALHNLLDFLISRPVDRGDSSGKALLNLRLRSSACRSELHCLFPFSNHYPLPTGYMASLSPLV